MEFEKTIEALNSKEDFIEFINLLVKDLKNNPNEWENKSLESYLKAISSWTEDMDGYYINHNLPIPSKVEWKVFATILIAAKIYE